MSDTGLSPEEEAFLKALERDLQYGEPKKYAISMAFEDALEDGAQFTFGPQTSSVITEKDFILKDIELVVRFTLTNAALSSQQINTVGNNMAPVFAGDVVFRDRREWCQGQIPLGLFLPDFGKPFEMKTPCIIPGRTEIFATVYPEIADRTIVDPISVTVKSYTLTFFLSGYHKS